MDQIGVLHAEDKDQDRIGDIVLVFVDVGQELIAHLILEPFEGMGQLKELIATRLRRRQLRVIEDDQQTGDAQNEEEDDQDVTELDDETGNVHREDRVVQAGQGGQGFVEDRGKVIEQTETGGERLTDLLVDDDEGNDHRDVHQEIEENAKTLERTVAPALAADVRGKALTMNKPNSCT